jgi:hypothetical protein
MLNPVVAFGFDGGEAVWHIVLADSIWAELTVQRDAVHVRRIYPEREIKIGLMGT